jgi:small conductance mechanosensitive channel
MLRQLQGVADRRRMSGSVMAGAFFFLVGGLAYGVGAAPAAALPQEQADTLSAEERFAATLDTVAELDRAVELIDSWDVGLEGIDGSLLEERRAVRTDRRRALLWRLAALTPELPPVQEEPDPRITLVDSLLRADAQELGSAIAAGLEEASMLAAEAVTLEGTARARAAARVQGLDSFIDEGLAAYNSSLDAMETLGIDMAEANDRLDGALGVRAELLAGRMARAQEEIDNLRSRMGQTATGVDGELAALNREIGETGENLERLLELMDDRGLPTTDFRRYLLVSTGNLTSDNLSWDVLQGLFADWTDRAGVWLRESGWNVLLRLLVFVAILALARFFATLVNRLMVKGLQASNLHMSTLLRETIVRWSTRLVMLLGLLIALSQVGVELGPLLAGLGVAGFVIGFALQDTLSNFASGVMILLYRPFDIDDLVTVSGVTGTVADMSLVSTTIKSIDNQRYIIPNSQIWGNVIQNVTAEDTRRVDLVFGIGYEDDIPEAERILQEIVEGHEQVLDEPTPMVKLSELGDSSVNFVVRPWCRTTDYWDVRFDIIRQVKLRFDEAGVSIPFPQRDVHVYHENGDPSPGASAGEVEVGTPAGASGSGPVGGIERGEAGQSEAENAPG